MNNREKSELLKILMKKRSLKASRREPLPSRMAVTMMARRRACASHQA